MLNFQEYFEENPDIIFHDGIYFREMAEKVKTQAITHMRRDSQKRLLDEKRPNEDDRVKEYRTKNNRLISKSVIDKYMDMLSRMFNKSGFQIKGASDLLNDNLESKPYTILGQNVGLQEFVFNCVVLQCLEDPNAVMVDIPYDPNNPSIPPIKSRSNQGTLEIETSIIGHENLLMVHPFLMFKGGVQILTDGKGKKTEHDYFWVADSVNWYKVEPTLQKRTDKGNVGKTKYEVILWYKHDTKVNGRPIVPLNFLCGILTTSPNGKYKYNESFAHSFFEFADEFVSKHSDYQGVSVQHHHPKMMMLEMDCLEPTCDNGNVKHQGQITGKCETCKGTGKIINPSVFDVIRFKGNRGVDNKSTLSPPIQYVTPPVASIDSSKDHAFDYLERGEKNLGLNVVTGSNESGEAKKVRMRVQDDNLSKIFRSIKPFIERHLYFKESILQPNANKREYAVLLEPNSFQNKDVDTLREEAENAIPSNKAMAQKAYLNKFYEGEPLKQKIYNLAYDYEPYIAFLNDEGYLERQIDLGCITCNDLIRINRTVWAFEQLAKQEGFISSSDASLYEKANDLIQPFLREVIPIFDGAASAEGSENGGGNTQLGEDGEPVITKNKLLETVGGVTGIIALSQAVADGKMTESAAENILVSIYEINRETAKTMIDVPPKKIEDLPPQRI